MAKIIIILLVAMLFSNCVTIKKRVATSLEGQKWIFERQIAPGYGSGISWSFFPNNWFTATNWYSGGAYWRNHFSGIYYYNTESKKVFLKYKKGKSPQLKKAMKQQLLLKIIGNDTTVIITNGWEKSKENQSNIQYNLKSKNTKLNNYTFKIERKRMESVEK